MTSRSATISPSVMPEPQRGDERARFSGFELDFRSGDLRRPDGSRIVLPDQPFRILAVLLKARGALVTREDLCRELWPDNTFVDFEHSLNAGVKRLREAIGDSATAPRFIETIPRRGYRFVAPVETSPPPPTARISRRRLTWLAAAAVATIAIAVWVGTSARSHS